MVHDIFTAKVGIDDVLSRDRLFQETSVKDITFYCRCAEVGQVVQALVVP
ncbi:hypothetical protein I546_0147 [Mycobacterium kansasii 732]|uniref:Uncharacterized protein n=2 Tax=Mycobacterium kansasii TaxID=1768 RepID=A0A1V3XCS2_MYCKA|nr:hypothetical protein O982_25245 [Mycobacterium avium 10-5581]EUA03062.1 hypothetical protein I547_1171 [Mycobacterium kansasii 824]EUA15241.1 hypothetical protein I546_0147 [Mycobacterium kansasii 732]EUA21075.1 hypothetical protein I545_0244 [Mycobacterium kansasii 662]KDP07097.1 hypothetical protein MAV100_15785 [Mycobacterium avium subsp. hominissuis 100]KEP43628.1 hypothetical protein MKSMC1_11940 [Mycobacterium kansasii]